MRALRFHSFGKLSNLRIEDLPVPAPGPGEVLVLVHAASLNPSDAKNVLGVFPATSLPRIPGRDLAGVIVAGDPERTGEEIWAAGGDIGSVRDGSHAEFILLPGMGARRKPKCLSMPEAASCGINYVTAYQALIVKARLKDGETVLITGASGGVGSSAVKIAKMLHARVISIDRGINRQVDRGGVGGSMRSGEPDLLLGSEAGDIENRVKEFTGGRGVDVVLDAVGGPLFEKVLDTLALDGRQVSIVSRGESRVSFDLSSFYHRRLTLYGVDTMAMDTVACGEVLDAIAPAFERGELTSPAVAGSISLDAAAKGYEEVDSGRAKGKLVIVFPA